MVVVEVLLPFPIPKYFTYSVPPDLVEEVRSGVRVVVHFGSRRVYTGLVRDVKVVDGLDFSTKDIIGVLDDRAIVNEKQFRFWEWLSEYYLCSQGEVMNVALPSAFRLSSETKIVLNSDFIVITDELSEKEFLIYEALQLRNVLTLAELQKVVNQTNIVKLIKQLIDCGMITVEEELSFRYKAKVVKYLKLAPEYENSEEELKRLMSDLEKRAFRQMELLLKYVQLSNFLTDHIADVEKRALYVNDKGAVSVVNTMIKKGIFVVEERVSSRLIEYRKEKSVEDIELSDKQSVALDEIRHFFDNKNVVLLKGVTGSGKTELYIKLIDEVLRRGEQALFLLPEIALTSQIVNRLKCYFGAKVVVYHSKFNDNERVEIWNAVINDGDAKLVIGARSAMFMPFTQLGLIIVDEEHDYSYKQSDPSPRYNARDASIYLASLYGAKVLLGSATPSVESYYNTKNGKYGLVELDERFGTVMMPEIVVSNLSEERRNKSMKSHLSSMLFEEMSRALECGEQVILFQNRRGFASYIECGKCGWTQHCKNCDVTLTYHKGSRQMKCHYCGYVAQIPTKCEQCGSEDLKMKGFGTERIEDEMPLLFPKAKVGRMDLDTTSGKYAHQTIIDDFDAGDIDILIGTQMITKGLDFKNVGLVGVLNADSIINYPDFRSFERGFQLITQVAGRAGRQQKRGKVVLQTIQPYHSVIRYAIDNDYASMYQSQIDERREYDYPPFSRMIKIILKSKDKGLLDRKAIELQTVFQRLNLTILGPQEPLVPRVQNYYISHMLLKLSRNAALTELKNRIYKLVTDFNNSAGNKGVRVIIDVDPIN